LIADDPWDGYHLDAILPLREQCPKEREFGFLLRHYWIPATQLQFRQSSRCTASDGTVAQCDAEIHRRMARCRSNECLWRETVFVISAMNDGNGTDAIDAAKTTQELCSYDCYEQAFRTREILSHEPYAPVAKPAARRQALCRLPILVPPGPVPLGFEWYARVGDDYMNFRLEAEEYAGETSVLIVRREGRYTLWLPESPPESGSEVPKFGRPYFHPHPDNFSAPIDSEDETKMVRMVTERKGVTLFASNRCAVLEDRLLDRVIEADGPWASAVGMTHQTLIRLVRSIPADEPSTVAANEGSDRVVNNDHCPIK
jgi:hypothetical protein